MTVMLEERTCRDCGYAFRVDPQRYIDAGLSPPTRCVKCRAQRRATRAPVVRLSGRVHYADPAGRFCKIDGDDGARYFSSRFEAPVDALRAGMAVTFERCDRPPAPGRDPRARVVRLADDEAAP